MARRIVWSIRSQNDRKSIFKYWNKRNKSNHYSKKLHKLFIASSEFIAIHPHTGRLTTKKDIRVKFISHFAMLYEYSDTELRVLTIFDTRQDPEKFIEE